MSKRKKQKAPHGEGHLMRKKRNGKPYGSYLIRYREGGERCYKNLRTTDFAEAKHLWHQWAISRQNGQGNGVSGKIEVVTWLQDFLRSREEAAVIKKSIKPATYNKDKVTVKNLTRFLESQYPGLKMADINVNRKMLAEIAATDEAGFAKLVEQVKVTLDAAP